MTIYDRSLSPERKGVLGWLGFRHSQPGEATDLSALARHLRDLALDARSTLMAGIAEFVARYELDVCPDVLSVAHDYVTRADPLLVRLIDERDASGLAVSAEWLKKLRGHERADKEVDDLHRMFERLEKQLIDFGTTATAARKATQDYGISLEGHVEQLGSAREFDTSVTQLLGVVRAMIKRTSEMEDEMSLSETQSRELRKDLEDALRCAEEDYLTGMPNRRAFERTFEREYREARLALEPLVVAFCDIDHFKRVNDAHGHDTGDRVLKAVARNLLRISSDRCCIARHGGEEFVVLFRGKSLEQATASLDEARMALCERRMVDRRTRTPIGYITFSAGIADVFAYPDRFTALKAADTALYLAKERGRNQIVTAGV
ncbi:MAG: GGDEF domain-containing protein [Novosphingobium sp.]|nr:GGDEF domain-containing protein [Novosphingobium sp.]